MLLPHASNVYIYYTTNRDTGSLGLSMNLSSRRKLIIICSKKLYIYIVYIYSLIYSLYIVYIYSLYNIYIYIIFGIVIIDHPLAFCFSMATSVFSPAGSPLGAFAAHPGSARGHA